LEGTLHGWLAGLRGHLETAGRLLVTQALQTPQQAVAIRIRHTSAEAYVGRGIYRGDRANIALMLSLGMDFVSAQISGYTDSRNEDFVDPFAAAGARAAWFGFGDVAFTAAADATYVWRRESFDAEGSNAAAAPHFRARFLGGVSWSPF